jgi:hypothetical protein
MKAEIEDVQRRSEMNVIRQRKRNQDLQEQNVQLQEQILALLEEVKTGQDELKKEIKKK